MTIDDIRKEIDRIDKALVELINRRAKCALEIGKLKKTSDESIFAPEREQQVLARVLAKNTGPLSDKTIEAIYREIISACRALEKPISVAYLGPEDSYTHTAGIQMFGASTEFTPAGAIADVFAAVERKSSDYGVVPIESSTEGTISHTLDMFLVSDLRICAEVNTAVSRFLVVGYSRPNPSGRDKTTIVFAAPNKSGTLSRALSIFDEEKINITMIESRPTRQMPWEHAFFVDFQGHEKDEAAQRLISKLSEQALFVRVIGSYPEAG